MKLSRKTYLILATFALLLATSAVLFKLLPERGKQENSSSSATHRTADLPEKSPAASEDTSSALRTKSKERPADASLTGKLDEDFNPANYQRQAMGESGSNASNAAIAYVQIPSSNRRAALPPNSMGEYEEQPTFTEETVGVRVRIEDVPAGTPISVVILDGGTFPGESGPSKIIKLERNSEISFRFTTSANIGHHRIRILPSGGRPRILDFTASEA